MTTNESRERRLAQLDSEILLLRDRIERARADEKMLLKTSDQSRRERTAELSDLRDERTSLESALFNLEKEYRELSR
jgi:hypothetical protein